MNSNKTFMAAAFALLIVGTAAPAVAGPEFLAYEGRNAVREGDGGERKTVDGVDFWLRGAPPRKFKVLGSLTDRRHETGIYGMIRMSSLDSDVAKAAKAAGGDAVVLEEEGEEVVGRAAFANTDVNGTAGPGYFHGNAFGSAFARDIKKHDARYVVVKYLDAPADASAAAPAPSAAR